MLKVPADGFGFFGIDGLHDQLPVVPAPLFGDAGRARQCRMQGDQRIGYADGVETGIKVDLLRVSGRNEPGTISPSVQLRGRCGR